MSTPITTAKVRFIKTVTIVNGTANGTPVLTADDYAKYGAISIIAPTTLAETVSPQAADTDVAAPNFRTIQSPPGTDITIPAAKAIVLTSKPFCQIRITSTSGNVAADRVFQVWGELNPVTGL